MENKVTICNELTHELCHFGDNSLIFSCVITGLFSQELKILIINFILSKCTNKRKSIKIKRKKVYLPTTQETFGLISIFDLHRASLLK